MTQPSRAQLDAAMSEEDLQQAVVSLARRLGYLVYHARPARTANGWRTPLTGMPGFPDLTLARDDCTALDWTPRFVLIELKSSKGRLSQEQACWIGVLRAAGCEVHVWRPRDWSSGEIERVLR